MLNHGPSKVYGTVRTVLLLAAQTRGMKGNLVPEQLSTKPSLMLRLQP